MSGDKTNYFLVFMHGQSGGMWFCMTCNNHPAGMWVLGEAHSSTQLDFKGHGWDKTKDYDRVILEFLQSAAHYKQTCAGIMLSFTGTHIQYVEARGGRIAQLMRNPLYIVRTRQYSKPAAAVYMFDKLYGREPVTDLEKFEGHCYYYADNYYEKFLRRGWEYPIIRLEDCNTSLKSDGVQYAHTMEWLTQTEWPMSYVAHVREHFTPAYSGTFDIGWDAQGHVCSVGNTRREEQHWGWRDNWEEDNQLAGDRHWGAWSEDEKAMYLKYFGDLDKRLGYNQHHVGGTDLDWEFMNAYDW